MLTDSTYIVFPTATPTSLRHINVDILQHRVRNLEDENKSLRLEACQIANDTQEIEDKEKELVSDVIKQLSKSCTHKKSTIPKVPAPKLQAHSGRILAGNHKSSI